MITAWRPLAEAGTEVSFMLWVADGSDILEYDGDLSRPLEWARYIGFCNADRDTYDSSHHQPTRSAIPYVENPREMRYADLSEIIAALRAVGTELLGRPLARSMHHECRVFVTQDRGVVGCDAGARDEHHTELTLIVRGLDRATVVFLPPPGAAVTLENAGRKHQFAPDHNRIELAGLSGELFIRW